MTQQFAGLPSPPQVIELLAADFAEAGYDVEDVLVVTGTSPRITVIADGDTPLDLDVIADLSRRASALLDEALPEDTPAYLLEVSSAGLDRPLTAEKHFRRARGRKAELALADGATVTGRLGGVDDGALDLVVRAGRDVAVRRIPLADIEKAVVQVEFSTPNPRELELAGVPGPQTGTEAAE